MYMPKKKQSIPRLCQEFQSAITNRSVLDDLVESMVRSNATAAVNALLDTIVDSHRRDNDRVDILKTLARDETYLGGRNRLRTAKCICDILHSDPNELVRQHAAQSLYFFADIDGVVDTLLKVAGNPTEHLELRCEAKAAIEHNPRIPNWIALFQQLASSPGIGEAIRRTLRTAHSPRETK